MIVYSSNPFTVLETTSAFEGARTRLTRKLHSFSTLPQGWSFSEGEPTSDVAILIAEKYVLIASQLSLAADVFPNLDGGCAVALYRGEDRVEVSVSPEGILSLRAERGIGPEFENIIEPVERATAGQVYERILRLLDNDQWNWFAYSTSVSTSRMFDVLETLSIRTRQPLKMDEPLLTDAGGFQSYSPIVRATK